MAFSKKRNSFNSSNKKDSSFVEGKSKRFAKKNARSESFSANSKSKNSSPSKNHSFSRPEQVQNHQSHDDLPRWPKDQRAVVGIHAVRELIKIRKSSVRKIWMKDDYESNVELVELVKDFKNKPGIIEKKSEKFMAKVAFSHQGVCVLSDDRPTFDLSSIKNSKTSKLIFLDGIEDPHNLGAIVRTAWLLGVDAVITPMDRSVQLTPSVHKVACGGVEYVPVESTVQFAQMIEECKKNDFWVYGLDAEGKNSIYDLKLPAKVAWVIGAEDKGLRVNIKKICDELVSIPQTNSTASLNASVATAIALSETCRQQKMSLD